MSGEVQILEVGLGERAYPIVLTSQLPGPIVAEHAQRVRERGRALVVTDSNVGPLYARGVREALEGVGYGVRVHTLAAGEQSKTLGVVSSVVDAALEGGLSRRDLIVALGGGVVGDIAGFAAAITYRGIAFIQVPTTLLAQVDSAVGGKTGVNHGLGKNLIGAFWQPRAVISSQAVLKTLPPAEVRCGLAEAIKHGFLADAELVARIGREAEALKALEDGPTRRLVADCCRIKAAIVEADELEAGQRALLNLGHTLGHAYERLMGYGALTHGEAVGLGTVQAARLSQRLGVARGEDLEDRVVAALSALGLPHDTEAEGLPGVADLVEAARTDKKGDGRTVRFVLLTDIGQPLIRETAFREIMEALS